jgi:Chaperone for flagella basal body P-ring formation
MSDGRKMRTLGSLLLLSILASRAVGQQSNPRLPISSQRVAEAMLAAGIPVTAAQVKLLSQVTTTGPDSGLEVINLAKWSEDRLRVELRCHDPRVCLPFYVLVEGGTAAISEAVSAQVAGSPRRDLFRVSRKQILMRNGDHATLMFEDRTVRITMAVICLQNGDRGETIRVASTDRKQFFKAEIVGSGLLKVTL